MMLSMVPLQGAVTGTRERLASSWRGALERLAALERQPALARRIVLGAWAATRLLLFLELLVGHGYCDPWFYKYAGDLAAGHLPYRDVAVEYPPLALLLILLPALPLLPFAGIAPRLDKAFVGPIITLPHPDPARYAPYAISFAIEMLALDALTLWLVLRVGRRLTPGDPLGIRSALLYVGLVFLSGALLQKFDLVMGTLCLAALLALAAERPAVAGACLGLAALVKGFPALALPVFVGYYLARAGRLDLRAALRAEARSLSRLMGAFAGMVAGATLLIAAFAGAGAVLHTLTYHVSRGLEIESFYANLLLALGWLPGAQVWTRFNGEDLSRVVRSPLEGAAGVLVLVALAAALTLAYVAAGRALLEARDVQQRMRGESQASAVSGAFLTGAVAGTTAVLLAFLLAFRALPAHYLLVVVPLAAVLRLPQASLNRLWFGGIVGVAVLGQVLTVVWQGLVDLRPWAVVVLSLRNCSWLLAFAVLIIALWTWTRSGIQPRAAGG